MLEVLLQLPWCHGKGRREELKGAGGELRGDGMDGGRKGRVEGGGGTMAHEGKVSQYYVFSPLLADKGKWSHVFCLQTSNILTPGYGAVRRCAAQERPVQPSARSSYLSHLDVWNGIDDCFLQEKNKHRELLLGISCLFKENYLACNSEKKARTRRRNHRGNIIGYR